MDRNKNAVMPAQAGIRSWMRQACRTPAFAGVTIFLLFTFPAFAAEDAPKEEPAKEETPVEKPLHVYSPEFCEFTISFPDEPYKTERCDDPEKKKCYQQTTYTQVFEMASTVNIRVICNEVDKSVRETYSGDIMKKTLAAMTSDTVIKTFDSAYREEKEYKQAGLVGEGKVGKLPSIFIAQLWISDKSAFSVEAELIGAESPEADAMFSEILRSIQYKGDVAPAAEEEKKE